MNKLLPSLILLLVFFTFSVRAEVDRKVAAIEKMFVIMGIDRQMAGGFEAMLPAVEQLASNLNLDAKEKEELKNIYRDWFEQDIDRVSMKKQVIDLYADNFSQQEIEEVIKFYQTPIGQKFLEKAPELMQLGVQIGMKEGQAKQQLLINRLTPFLEKHKK